MQRIFREYFQVVGRSQLRMLVLEEGKLVPSLLLPGLERAGLRVDMVSMGNLEAVRQAIGEDEWDLALYDLRKPNHELRGILQDLQSIAPELPVIVFSSHRGADGAAEAFECGATDFVSQGCLSLFPAALARTLREVLVARERTKVETLLRASERKYRRMVEAATEGVATLKANGEITFANRSFAEMMRSAPDDLLGVVISDLITLPQASLGNLESVLLGAVVFRSEVQFRRGPDSQGWGIVSCTPLDSSGNGSPTHLLMLTDTTERRALQAQLAIADRMAAVGMLAAGVAHEINNPLAVTLANLDLIARDADLLRAEAPSELTEGLCEEAEDALVGARRVAGIVKDLRLFSRAETAAITAIDVRPIVDSCCRMARNEIRHRAKLVKDYSPVALVDANEARLSQVVINLLVNAAHAIPEGNIHENQITLTTSTAADGRVQITVRDTGVGMAPEQLRQLFTPFYTTKPAAIGTGLGLAISRRIVEELGGEIRVQSEPGKGSEFTLFLPPSRTPTLMPAAIESSVPMPTQRARLLVIDDEPAIRATIHRALADRHDVVLATGAKQALDELAAHDYDAVLCDVMMPEMSGFKLFEIAVTRDPDLQRRFAFLSGGLRNEQLRQFLEANPERLALEKPFNVLRLQRFVEDVLERARPALRSP